MLAFAVSSLDAVGAGAAPQPKPAAAPYPFTFETLQQDAEKRAAKPYAPQHNSLPAALDKLSPEQYRSIHFNPSAGIWLAEKLPSVSSCCGPDTISRASLPSQRWRTAWRRM